jgi:hypothetical protein
MKVRTGRLVKVLSILGMRQKGGLIRTAFSNAELKGILTIMAGLAIMAIRGTGYGSRPRFACR